jgi:tRNA A-37 threonylcarbamoyl transferase component Bud32
MSEDRTLINTVRKCPMCHGTFGADSATCPEDGTLLMPVRQDAMIGTLFAGKYRITEELGRGGMSIVYKGMHELMHRPVAIKIMQAELLSDAISVRRFQQESEAASRLAHPHVVTAFDFGVTDTAQPYLVLDLVDGTSLAEELKRDGKLSPRRTIHIFKQICEALDHAHQRGVVHRDLKPSNIMLTNSHSETDFVKVVDFGIAKLMATPMHEPQNLTKSGEIFGSPLYMSPEQCLGETPDQRTDIYATGIMLYETLTGKMPLVGPTFFETMQMQISTPPRPFNAINPNLKIPTELEAVVFKAIEKKQEARYQSMREFNSALQNVSRQLGFEEGIIPTPNIDQQQTTAPKSMTSQLIVLVSAIAIICTAAFLINKFSATPTPSAPDEHVKGTLWYYDPEAKPGFLIINNKEDGYQKIFTGDSRLEHVAEKPQESVRNGADWDVAFRRVNEKPMLEEKGTKFEGSFNKDIVAVDELIRNHFEEMADGKYEEAFQDFSPWFRKLPPKSALIADWKKTKWKKGCSHAPITAIKFLAQSNISITALLDGSQFLDGVTQNWRTVFAKEGDSWKFQGLDTATKNPDSNAETAKEH